MISVLLTGFGPFPGAPFNPTQELVERLARLRRPALAGIHTHRHIFQTSYRAVDRELPRLIARHKPDVLLMFGLAARTKHMRIETRARNMLAAFPDAERAKPRKRSIARGAAGARALRIPRQIVLTAASATGVPVKLSRDAGAYLCNYLCWRALEAADKRGGPRLVSFIHVPAIPRSIHPRHAGRNRQITMNDLIRTGAAILMTLVGQARRS